MITATLADGPVVWAQVLRRLDQPGPRSISCPTDDRFAASFGPDDDERALNLRLPGTARPASGAPLSPDVHIPSCKSLGDRVI